MRPNALNIQLKFDVNDRNKVQIHNHRRGEKKIGSREKTILFSSMTIYDQRCKYMSLNKKLLQFYTGSY